MAACSRKNVAPGRSCAYLRLEVRQALRHHLARRQPPHPGHEHRAIALGVERYGLGHNHIEQGFHCVLLVAFCLQACWVKLSWSVTRRRRAKYVPGHFDYARWASSVLCRGPALLRFGTTGSTKAKSAHNRTAVATTTVVVVYCCTLLHATETTAANSYQGISFQATHKAQS